ncbi:MAG TPA: glycosyltransferase family A protein [Candidatus Elarobacter sp.]|jgi:glycosyltransferase involved in cell wall biosynthesis|nr:glycosyltransferase family A protein [Candidatus Elarobacter sp.]
MAPKLSIQLCTYNRAHLLERVLEACFDQTLAADDYEIVLVNDGSRDDTEAVIERARAIATCRFVAVTRENGGLAKARNTGIDLCAGERIAFIDDDVLPTPVFAAEHLKSDARHGDVVVRGAAINTESLDALPVPVWTPLNYSGNWFWTTNVSVRRSRLDAVGGRFDESFSEYGWEDIELGMRLRAIGTKAVFNRFALAFHYKPRAKAANVDGMLRQVRAQARTAVRLEQLHPNWRVALAIGDTRAQRFLGDALRKSGLVPRLEKIVGTAGGDESLSAPKRAAAQLLASAAYYDELERAKRG